MSKLAVIIVVVFVLTVLGVGTMENFVGLSLQEIFIKDTDQINCFCDDTEAECVISSDQTACDKIITAP